MRNGPADLSRAAFVSSHQTGLLTELQPDTIYRIFASPEKP